MSCSWSLTSSTNVPSEIDQLSSMQVTPNGQPRQAMAKGSASTPAPTIEVKLCLFSFVFCFFSSGFFVFRERGREAKATRPPPGSLRSPNLHLKPSHSPRTQKGPTRRAGTCPCGASPPPPWSVFFFNEKFGVERGTTTRAAATSARFLVCPFFSFQFHTASPAAVPFSLRDSVASQQRRASICRLASGGAQGSLPVEAIRACRRRYAEPLKNKKKQKLGTDSAATFPCDSYHSAGRVVEHLRPEGAQTESH